MNFSTKSGTNDLHGELYEYVRNRVLNANDPVNKAKELSKGLPNKPGSFTQNQFGANAAGPFEFPMFTMGATKPFGSSVGKLSAPARRFTCLDHCAHTR